jgi:hypothetical protein
MSIYKANISSDSLDSSVLLRNKITKLYILFCKIFNIDVIILLIFFFIFELFFVKSFLILLVSVTWLPQIFYNYRMGSKSKVDFSSILIISLNKLFVPV